MTRFKFFLPQLIFKKKLRYKTKKHTSFISLRNSDKKFFDDLVIEVETIQISYFILFPSLKKCLFLNKKLLNVIQITRVCSLKREPKILLQKKSFKKVQFAVGPVMALVRSKRSGRT